MNYGHATELYIIFVHEKRAQDMDYVIVDVREAGKVSIKKQTGSKEDWDRLGEKYNGDIWNDKAFLYDHLRPGGDVKYMGDLIAQCFEIGVELI